MNKNQFHSNLNAKNQNPNILNYVHACISFLIKIDLNCTIGIFKKKNEEHK